MAENIVSLSDIRCTSKEGHDMHFHDIGRKDNIKMTDHVCIHCGLTIREKTEMLLVHMGEAAKKKTHKNYARFAALHDISECIKNSPEYERGYTVTAGHLARDSNISKLNAELGLHTINKTPEKMRRNSRRFKSIYDELGTSWQKTGFM